MTDELKDRFQQLVADPPPPSTAPRDAVFGRIRKAKRRRTAGVSAVAAAVAVAAVVALSNVADVNSEPPLIGPPPSSSQSSTPTSPAAPKIGVTAHLTPKLSGRTMTLTIKVAGTVMLPLDDVGNPLSRQDEFLNFATGGTEYKFGDRTDEDSGSDPGGILCKGAKQQITGTQTYSLPAHTYAKAGTYTITYKATFCGPNDKPVIATKTTTIQVP